MQIVDFHIGKLPSIKADAMCIGKFDGIHLGHEALLRKCKEVAGHGTCAVLTFQPLPFVFFGKTELLIYTEEEKEHVVQHYGIDFFFRLKFDEELSKMNGEDFLQYILKITKNIVVGEDFRFGYKQGYCVDDLLALQNQFGYKAHIVEKVASGNAKASSTQLKNFIADGNFEEYEKVSTTPFFAMGEVISGMKMAGEVLGFPTANVILPNNKIMPPFGVYATSTEAGGIHYKSVSNYGIKPTVANANIPILETHLLNFNDNLYGKKITVSFLKKIRNEQKFENINQLQFQISKDIKTATLFHRQYENNKI
ncbi:MAG: riboflavin biosynthesis protein RibF [Proteobacteria bacterium]|jgi:riboflavin kinase / FMN adenylyltransferase|nr:riboflavin biosynthesis protein RibF [Pseudomonadota bacterium]